LLQFSAIVPVVLVLVGTTADLRRFIKELSYPKWALEAFIIAGAKELVSCFFNRSHQVVKKHVYDVINQTFV